MNRYAVDKWNNNKGHLRKALMGLSKEQKGKLDYSDLMVLCVKYILNVDADEEEQYCEEVEMVLSGGYSGFYLFVIMPKEYRGEGGEVGRVLVSYAHYGSCALCDCLEGIQKRAFDGEDVTDDLMALCKDLICDIVKPYNEGWRYDERFATIREEWGEDE